MKRPSIERQLLHRDDRLLFPNSDSRLKAIAEIPPCVFSFFGEVPRLLPWTCLPSNDSFAVFPSIKMRLGQSFQLSPFGGDMGDSANKLKLFYVLGKTNNSDHGCETFSKSPPPPSPPMRRRKVSFHIIVSNSAISRYEDWVISFCPKLQLRMGQSRTRAP